MDRKRKQGEKASKHQNRGHNQDQYMSKNIKNANKRRKRFKLLAKGADVFKIGERIGKIQDNCHKCRTDESETSISDQNSNPLICCAYCTTVVHENCLVYGDPIDWNGSKPINEMSRHYINRFICYRCELRCFGDLKESESSKKEESSSDEESVSVSKVRSDEEESVESLESNHNRCGCFIGKCHYYPDQCPLYYVDDG